MFPDLHILHRFRLVVVQCHFGLPALGVFEGDWLVARPYHDRPFVLQRPASTEMVTALWHPDRVTVLMAEVHDPSQTHHPPRPRLLP